MNFHDNWDGEETKVIEHNPRLVPAKRRKRKGEYEMLPSFRCDHECPTFSELPAVGDSL
jgi:hypothetical protein